MSATHGDACRSQLVAAIVFLRSRLLSVLKDKRDLGFRLDVAETRADRLLQEKERHERLIKQHTSYSKRLWSYFQDAKEKHSIVLDMFKTTRDERDSLLKEKADLQRRLEKVENCLGKTREAFTKLQTINIEKKEELRLFADACNDLEKRKADAWVTARRYADELGIVRTQYESLVNMVGMSQSGGYHAY